MCKFPFIHIFIKKVALPQREKIGFLVKEENKFLSKNTKPYFRDIQDHSIRVSDSIDNYREAVGNTFDVYMSAVSNNMNDVMKTLSIIQECCVLDWAIFNSPTFSKAVLI